MEKGKRKRREDVTAPTACATGYASANGITL
jgi:hypothetical protein